MAAKNAAKILPYRQDSTRTGYELIHCSTVGQFLVFDLKVIVDPSAKTKPPLMGNNDYVIMFRRDVSLKSDNNIGGKH